MIVSNLGINMYPSPITLCLFVYRAGSDLTWWLKMHVERHSNTRRELTYLKLFTCDQITREASQCQVPGPKVNVNGCELEEAGKGFGWIGIHPCCGGGER